MKLNLKSSHLSIKSLTAPPLPPFAVLIGRNGVGKSQLLDAIQQGSASTPEGTVIEKYDIASSRPPSSEAASWGGSLAASTAAHLLSLA